MAKCPQCGKNIKNEEKHSFNDIEKLFDEHEKFMERHNIKVYNLGWFADDKSVISKSSAGNVTSKWKNGKIVHETEELIW